jgi:uncharacterized protein (DUF1501 family)
MTHFNRRAFLSKALNIGAASTFLTTQHIFGSFTPLLYAQENQGQALALPDRYYIFCYFSGGWDILVGLDPRDPRQFNDGNLRQTLIQPGYDRLANSSRDIRIDESTGMMFGPHMGELVNHASKLAIVRGMSMDTLTHEAGRRRFLTGKPPSGLLARGSSANTWLSAKLGSNELIPNLSIRVESYNQDLPNYASALRVGGAEDLLRTLRPANPSLDPRLDQQINQSMLDLAQCDRTTASRFLKKSEDARIKAKQMTSQDFGRYFDFSRPEYANLRGHYGFTNVVDSPAVSAAMAVQAITNGLSRCVSIEAANGLDTHFDNWTTDQGNNQQRGFNIIARMIEDLASRPYKDTGESWLDKTVIVAFSEFSRTPLLNDRGGRDHALTNACLLAGGGIKGGQVVGKSSDLGMQPVSINPATGEIIDHPEFGEVIRPENILQTLYHEVGIGAEADLRVSPILPLFKA